MDKVPSIVQGEASESDSDDEIPIGKCVSYFSNYCFISRLPIAKEKLSIYSAYF